jgi:phosphatidylserine/phosphatidylglycerophosphate/cardiolipin synthase-like enzyme
MLPYPSHVQVGDNTGRVRGNDGGLGIGVIQRDLLERSHGAPMHLKSYQIDGRVLRTGTANFSASGLKRQDNDLIIIDSPVAAANFRRAFETRFASGEAISLVGSN